MANASAVHPDRVRSALKAADGEFIDENSVVLSLAHEMRSALLPLVAVRNRSAWTTPLISLRVVFLSCNDNVITL
jgi:hypothetical protein